MASPTLRLIVEGALRPQFAVAPRAPQDSRGSSTPASELVIQIDDAGVEVRDPAGGFELGAAAIQQLFVVERQPRTGFLTWFGVFARCRGRADCLLLETPDSRVARFIERAIEDRLGLADEPVRGELRLSP